MKWAISSMGTCGRNVLGPGRMISSMPLWPLELLLAKQAEHDPLDVHDHAGVPSSGADAFADPLDPFLEPARRHVGARYVSRPRTLGIRALRGQAGGQPVELAVHVVADLGEAERFEPPRGSWAHVSGRVPAVDNDRPARIEPPAGLGLDRGKGTWMAPGR
jgi:hypothetical protein